MMKNYTAGHDMGTAGRTREQQAFRVSYFQIR